MRLSADVVKAAPACLNAIKQAELTLRGDLRFRLLVLSFVHDIVRRFFIFGRLIRLGMKLNAIENLGVTQVRNGMPPRCSMISLA